MIFSPEDTVHATPPAVLSTLPSLTNNQSDRQFLIDQQQKDPSLKTVRQLADGQECDYAYTDGVLTHLEKISLDTPMRQVILPVQRRLNAIELAHDSHLGGHCGVKRTLRRLGFCVTCPNMGREVTTYVRQCGPSQKYASFFC